LEETLKSYRDLLRFEDVKRFYQEKALRSSVTAEGYLNCLWAFYKFTGLTPDELVKEGVKDPLKAERRLTDFVIWLYNEAKDPKTGRRGLATATVSNRWTGIKSFYTFHGIEIKKKPPFDRGEPPETVDVIPTQDQLRKILDCADLRAKTLISLMAFAGLRPETAIKLRIRDLKDLALTDKGIEIKKTPLHVSIHPIARLPSGAREKRVKRTRRYDTFIIKEGCEYLQTYLENRLRRGEQLTSDSFIIASVAIQQNATKVTGKTKSKLIGTPITRKGAWHIISKAFEKAGVDQRPYVLRKYFKNRLISAGIQEVYSEYFMGHKGGLARRYGLSTELPAEEVEELRQAYEKAESFLTSYPKPLSEEEIRKKAIIDQAKLLYSDRPELLEKIVKLVEAAPTVEKAIELSVDLMKQKPKTERNGGAINGTFKVIEEAELIPHLEQGYEIMRELSNGKIIVRKTI
jgi:integrase